MPLAFEPGEEAQVDWHEAVAKINGVERKVQVFCMRLCHSKASFTWPSERATLESFLDGHVGAGQDRRLNERFKPLRWSRLVRYAVLQRGSGQRER